MSRVPEVDATLRSYAEGAPAPKNEWWLLWCGHATKGSPYPTREAAEAALQRLDESRIAAKQPMYGSYAIKKLRRHP